MKKIINGARYDTDTAKLIGGAAANCLPSDFNYWECDLYRTKPGRYFLHRQNFGHRHPDGSTGWGEEILPVTEDAARAWAEQNLTADEYEAAFGTPTEDARFTVVLPEPLLNKLDARKEAQHASRSEIVIAALNAYLKG